MNVPAHILTELAGVAEVLEKLFRSSEAHQATTQQDAQQAHQKLDAWIQTNQAILGSNQELLKLIVQNSQALRQLTSSYESGISSWQDSQQQLRQFDAAVSSLSEQLVQQVEANRLATASIPAQLQAPPSSPAQATRSKHPALSLSFELVRRATAPLAGLGALLLAAGSGVGFAFAQVQQPPPPLYVTDMQEPLTLEEADLLAWAKSDEGELAKHLMDWNSGMFDSLACTDEVKRLGVTLEVQGRPATYGFCTVWVVPPNKRQFED